MVKILQARQWTVNFQMFNLDLEKAEEPEIKLPTSIGSEKAREFQKYIYFCFIDYIKAFDRVDHDKLWNILSLVTRLVKNPPTMQETPVKFLGWEDPL